VVHLFVAVQSLQVWVEGGLVQGAKVQSRDGLLNPRDAVVGLGSVVDGHTDKASSIGVCLGRRESPVGPGVEAQDFDAEVPG